MTSDHDHFETQHDKLATIVGPDANRKQLPRNGQPFGVIDSDANDSTLGTSDSLERSLPHIVASLADYYSSSRQSSETAIRLARRSVEYLIDKGRRTWAEVEGDDLPEWTERSFPLGSGRRLQPPAKKTKQMRRSAARRLVRTAHALGAIDKAQLERLLGGLRAESSNGKSAARPKRTESPPVSERRHKRPQRDVPRTNCSG